MHHTKDKGDIGVLKAQVDLAEKGYIICIPLTEHASFDLLIWKAGIATTVQVKYRSMNERGSLEVHFKSVWSDRHGIHKKPMDKSEVDIVCIYCPETDRCYYLDPKQHGKTVNLRVRESKNRQVKGVNLASRFTNLPE